MKLLTHNKNPKKELPKDGISNIRFKDSHNKNNPVLSLIFSIIIVSVTLIGTILTFTSMFYIRVNVGVIVAVAVLFSAGFCTAIKKPVSMLIITPLFLIVGTLFVAFMFSDIAKGFDLIYNDVIAGLNYNMSWNIPGQLYIWMPEYTYSITMVMAVVTAALSLLLTVFIVGKPSILGVIILTFPFFLSGTAFGAVPGYFEVALLFAGWGAVITIKMSAVKNKKAKDNSDFVKSGKKHIFAKSNKSMVSLGVGLVTLVTVPTIFFATFGTLNATGFDRSSSLDALRENITDFFYELINYSPNRDLGGLYEGNLSVIEDRVVKNKPYLKIYGPKSDETQYLKGFVGSKYTSEAWVTLDNYASYSDLFSKAGSLNIYPQNFTGALLSTVAQKDKSLGRAFKSTTITPMNVVRDYGFVFYNSYFESGFGFENDTLVIPSNPNIYNYSYFVGDSNAKKVRKSTLFSNSDFMDLWNDYRRFVYEEYTKLPDEGLKTFKIHYTKDNPGDIYEYGEKIRAEFESDYTYNTDVDKVPYGEDFTETFLYDQKNGYCVHFATAATLMFRAAGIPARYVEGYIVPSDKYNGLKADENGNYEITITDKEAHAWVEIFDDELGWVKYEVTPGYYVKTEQQEQPQEIPEEDWVPDIDDAEIDLDDLEGDKDSDKGSSSSDVHVFIIDFIKVWCGWALAISIIFLLAGLLAIRRLVSIRTRKTALYGEDNTQTVRCIYDYFSKILFFELIENKDNKAYFKYAEYMCEKSRLLDKDKTREVMAIFVQSRFDYIEITDEQVECVREFTLEYAKEVYTNANTLNRWIFATIRNLY